MATDGPDIIAHYEGDPAKQGTLWTPPVGAEEIEETTVPRLLHVPLVLFDKIRKVGCPLMLHKVLLLIM